CYFNLLAPTSLCPLSLHDALPICILLGFVAWFILRYIVTSFYVVNQNERAVKTSFGRAQRLRASSTHGGHATILETPLADTLLRSEEHTSELQSLTNLVCRLLLEK